MPYDLLNQLGWLPVFALVASRLGGLIMFQPILGVAGVPVRLRLLLVAGLAALVTPLAHLSAAPPNTPAGLAVAMAGELGLGLLIGLTVWLCFLGLQVGGLLIAQESGLALGQIADPSSGMEETVVGSFYLNTGIVVFLIAGGHRAVVNACLDTFETIPLLAAHRVWSDGVPLLLEALAAGCRLAVHVAGPTLVTLFLINVALGFISRTVPQLNIATVGFSVKALLGFVVMAAALPAALTSFTEGFEQALEWMAEFTGG
jgi:flagellar biosynthesis protein FliR